MVGLFFLIIANISFHTEFFLIQVSVGLMFFLVSARLDNRLAFSNLLPKVQFWSMIALNPVVQNMIKLILG